MQIENTQLKIGNFVSRKFTLLTGNATTALYLMYAGYSRFKVEIIRTNARYSALELSSAQFISIIMFIIWISMLLNINKLKVFDGKN